MEPIEGVYSDQPSRERAERLVLMLMREDILVCVTPEPNGHWRIAVQKKDKAMLIQFAIIVSD